MSIPIMIEHTWGIKDNNGIDWRVIDSKVEGEAIRVLTLKTLSQPLQRGGT